MNLAHYEKHSLIYGPGTRFVIWVQGCSLHCPGCWNQDMWSFEERLVMSKEQLWDLILSTKNSIEGITWLGGEPLDQYNDVLWISQKAFAQKISVMLFTGYEIEEIESLQHTEILAYVDILIPGRYIKELRDTALQWRGSRNQQVYYLTSRYQADVIQEGNYIEIHWDDFGKMRVLGFPEFKDWPEFYENP